MTDSADYSPILFGHDHAIAQITDAFSSGRMHHAWLITGIEGIGKGTLAYHIAHHVLSGGKNPIGKLDMNHAAAKLITADAHPDMIVVQRQTDDKTGELRNVIVVDDVLKLAPFMHKTATHGGWRVAIVDEAHMLNHHGQNAILKILEEPPARCLIIMTVTAPGTLLPTIRSRCRVLPLEPLSTDILQTVLLRTKPDMDNNEIAQAIAMAEGSAGFALKMIETGSLPLYENLRELLREMPNLDTTKLHRLGDQIARKSDAKSFSVIVSLLTGIVRKAIYTQALNAPVLAGDCLQFPAGRLDQSLALWDKVQATFAMSDNANLDRKLAFITAMTDIRRAVV